MTKNFEIIRAKLLALCILLLSVGCKNQEIRYFVNETRSQEDRIIRWQRHNDEVTIDFLEKNESQCYEVYERLMLKRFDDVIALRQNGFWIPYLYFDHSKAAIYGSGYTNYTRFVRNELFGYTDDGFILVQEREDLDGTVDLFYLQYSDELVPLSCIGFDSVTVYQKGRVLQNEVVIQHLCSTTGG